MGAHVIMAVRSMSRGERGKAEIERELAGRGKKNVSLEVRYICGLDQFST
jgi:hypothetical protein